MGAFGLFAGERWFRDSGNTEESRGIGSLWDVLTEAEDRKQKSLGLLFSEVTNGSEKNYGLRNHR